MTSVEIIGHRGFSAAAPENTLVSLREALDAGADAVEWDMHVAACGTAVLIHDEDLQRTTNGSGAVSRYSVKELKVLDAGTWFDARFAGEPIPSFAEALEELRPYGASVYAEVKGYREVGDLERMAQVLRDSEMAERTAFISLDFDIADHLARFEATARIGYVVSKHQQFQDALRRARTLGPRGLVDLDYRLILEDPMLVPRARAQGVDVAVWTVDELDDARALVEAGVRRLTTNQVERLVTWRREQRQSGEG